MLDPVSRLVLRPSHGTLHAPQPLGAVRPRVTVVIPCYNYGRYLPACVASAFDHVDVDVDVVIVDDASDDGSGEIADQLAAGDPRVSVIHHKTNKRHLATYNDGFAAATGEYLVQLSADDLLPTNSLTRSTALLEAMPHVGFCYGFARHFRGEVPKPETETTGWATWAGADWIAARCRSGLNVIQTTEVTMRTDLVRSVGCYRSDLPHSGDLELWMRLATAADVGFVAGPDQALYRLHDTNMHAEEFSHGTYDGQLVDLDHRWRAFAALFDYSAKRELPAITLLEPTARRTFAREALSTAAYAFARKQRGFPFERFEEFAEGLDPDVRGSRPARELARRQRAGMSQLPIHPRLAHRVLGQRARHAMIRWRRKRVGV